MPTRARSFGQNVRWEKKRASTRGLINTRRANQLQGGLLSVLVVIDPQRRTRQGSLVKGLEAGRAACALVYIVFSVGLVQRRAGLRHGHSAMGSPASWCPVLRSEPGSRPRALGVRIECAVRGSGA